MGKPALREPRHRVERRAIAWWAASRFTTLGLVTLGLVALATFWADSRIATVPLASEGA